MYIGSIIYSAVKPILKIYFIIGVGFLLGRKNILSVEASRNISDIIVSLILPCLIFENVVTNIQNSDIKQIGIIGFFSFLLFGIGGLSAYFCYLLNRPKFWRGGAICVGLMPNISDLPIAYLQTFASGLVFTKAQGDKGVAYICIFTAFQVFCQFNMGLVKLIGQDIEMQQKEKDDIEVNNRVEDKLKSPNSSETSETETGHESIQRNQQIDEQIKEQIQPVHSERGTERDDESEEEEEIQNEPSDNNIIPLTRASTSASSLSNATGFSRTSVTSIRRERSRALQQIITEYSQAEDLKTGVSAPGEFTEMKVIPKDTKTRPIFIKALLFVLDNFKKPLSLSLVISITISMIPWVKALFVVSNQTTIHPAPDKLPPLSFIMDYASYLAEVCVPFGLLMLGATLSRLSIGEMPSGYWITPLALTLMRLVISPMIGVGIVIGISKAGWFDDNDLLKFVCTIVWGLPNATSIIYVTAFYTPVDNEGFIQMDYLALTYIFQYSILAISLPFLTTFTMKVLLNY